MKWKAKSSPSGTKQIIMFCLLLRSHHLKMQQYQASNASGTRSRLIWTHDWLSVFIYIHTATAKFLQVNILLSCRNLGPSILLFPHQTYSPPQKKNNKKKKLQSCCFRRLWNSCIILISFSYKNDKPLNASRWSEMTLAVAELLQTHSPLSCFFILTGFAWLAVWVGARGSDRGRGGGGGQSRRFIPILRTSLWGLDTFDPPGMAVSFVMSFCLALNMKKMC